MKKSGSLWQRPAWKEQRDMDTARPRSTFRMQRFSGWELSTQRQRQVTTLLKTPFVCLTLHHLVHGWKTTECFHDSKKMLEDQINNALQAALLLNADTLGALQSLSWATLTIRNKRLHCMQKIQENTKYMLKGLFIRFIHFSRLQTSVVLNI